MALISLQKENFHRHLKFCDVANGKFVRRKSIKKVFKKSKLTELINLSKVGISNLMNVSDLQLIKEYFLIISMALDKIVRDNFLDINLGCY